MTFHIRQLHIRISHRPRATYPVKHSILNNQRSVKPLEYSARLGTRKPTSQRTGLFRVRSDASSRYELDANTNAILAPMIVGNPTESLWIQSRARVASRAASHAHFAKQLDLKVRIMSWTAAPRATVRSAPVASSMYLGPNLSSSASS